MEPTFSGDSCGYSSDGAKALLRWDVTTSKDAMPRRPYMNRSVLTAAIWRRISELSYLDPFDIALRIAALSRSHALLRDDYVVRHSSLPVLFKRPTQWEKENFRQFEDCRQPETSSSPHGNRSFRGWWWWYCLRDKNNLGPAKLFSPPDQHEAVRWR